MAGVADSAVGAILEIPTTALRNIKKAEAAIWALHDASKKAADQIYGDFATRMPRGIDAFINKLAEAKKAMDGLGTINVTLNTQAAVSNAEQLSTATQRTATDVSRAVQEMSQSWESLAGKAPKGIEFISFDAIQKTEDALKRLKTARDNVATSEGGRGAITEFAEGFTLSRQELSNLIAYLEKYIKLWKESATAKAEALSKVQSATDRDILSEQNKLLEDRLKWQKKINELQSTETTRMAKKGVGLDADETQQMTDYGRRISEVNAKLVELAGRYSQLSVQGQEAWQTNQIDALIRKQESNIALTQKEAEALERIKTAQQREAAKEQNKTDKEYLDRQKQAYKDILDLKKQINEQSVKVAKGSITDSSTLEKDKKDLQDLRTRLAETQRAWREYDKAATRGELSDKGATTARTKHVELLNALLKEQRSYQEDLNKAVVNGNEVTAQAQALKARLGNTKEAAIQRQLNSDYKAMLNIIKEQGEIKAKVASEGRQMNQQEKDLITALGQRYRLCYEDISRLSGAFGNISSAMAKMFQQDKSEQLARNAVLLADAQRKAEGNTSSLVAEYKRLYAENQKLLASIDLYNQKLAGTKPIGDTTNVSASMVSIVDRQADVQRQMMDLERKNIQEITDFRMQKDMEANQKSISDFIQAEAQKTAEAKRQASIQAQDRLEKYKQSLSTYAGAMRQYNTLGTRGGAYADTFENRERVIKNLESAIKNLNKADSDYESKLNTLTTALNKLRTAQKEVTDVMKPPKPVVSPQDAITAAKNATTLKQLQDAYKQLQTAMANTDPKSQKWADMNSQLQKTKTQIDEIKKKMGEFRNESNRTSNTMSQLQSRIAAAFSIASINGFIKKMVEVRAQFELQRVALGAIIQDRDEANKIFTQVQNMALESPFNIMQLEKATKQIAAFGFETKKLVPTMKMFADISAGLGVEIDRLVLVMGHLKARNFLEGTMVRQFTNMGFNVLGELSKYYTELEGKMVAVGEVQDRVKKKMVSFEDVEEVLKRVTSAGGMFYDMQKKQSESLWGQLQRIQDAYDLMLNSIGQSNEGVLKDALAFIRSMINHWRVLAPIIKDIGYSMAAVFAVKGIKALLIGFTTLGTMLKRLPIYLRAIRRSIHSINMAWSTTGIGLLITMAVTAVEVFRGLRAESEALNEELGRIETEGVSNMYNLIFQYRQLADTIRDSNATYEERQKALDEVKRIYKDILPDQMLEIENIRKMKNGYNEATDAIKAYYAEKIKQQKIEAIDTEYGKEITKALDKQAKHFTKLIYSKIKDLPQLEGITEKQIQGAIRNIMATIVEDVKNGDITMEQASDKFKEQFLNTFAISDEYYNSISEKMRGRLDNIFKKAFKGWKTGGEISFRVKGVEDVINKIEEAKGALTELGSFTTVQNIQAQPVIEEYDGLKKAVDEYKKALIALRDEQEKGNVGGELKQSTSGALYAHDVKGLGQTALDNLNQAILNVQYAMQGFGSDFEITADQVNGALQSEVDQMEYFDKVNEQTFGNAIRNFNSFYSEFENNSFMQNMVEKWNTAWNELNMTEPQKKVAEFQRKIASDMGVSVDIFKRFKLESIKSYDAARRKAKELSDESAENIKRIASTRIELIKLGMSAADAQREAERIHGNGKTEEEIKQEQKAYESLSRALGNYDKSKSGKSQDKELKRWQDLKKAIEDVTTQYDKLRKSYDVTESNKRIEELFGATFKELGADIHDFYKNGKYDANELIKALEVLKGMTKATTEERKKFRSEIERKIAGTEVEIDIKLREDSEKKLKADIDKMFDNYELTNELIKIGVNVDLTYMVGGKPTTLEDIRKDIERLKAEGGGNADAENRIKILEEAEKKITDIELKEQKERLKNYEKYLTKMYSDRAQKMISAYTTMSNMEEDFQSYIQKLMAEQSDAGTTDARKKQIAKGISMLQNQYAEAIRGVQRELNEAMAKADWNAFKGSDIFEQMYQDLSSLSKKGIDALIVRLEEMRDKLQSVSDIDPKAVREVTQYIEKLKNAKLDFAPFAGFRTALKEARDLKKEYGSIEASQLKLIELNDQTNAYTQQIDDLSTIIKLLDDGKEIKGKDAESTERLGKLYEANKDNLQGALELARENLKITQKDADELSRKINLAGKLNSAYEKQVSKLNAWKEQITSITNSVFDLVDAFGFDVDDEWKQLANTLINATVQAIALQMQLEMLKVAAEMFGVALNSALGTIGLIATALSAVVGIFSALFGQKDKRLKREIQKIQDRVDALSKSFKKLQKSIEQAFSIKKETDTTNQALNNLRQQKREYEQMIRLEKQKKKTDWSQVKEYEDKIEELAEAEQELYEKHHKKWGSTNDVWDEANNWVDAWLEAYKETGDGLDALNESWDEFYENLIKKQAVSKALGPLMDGYIKEINDALDKNMGSEYDYIDWFKDIRERIKADFQAANEELKKLFEYAGIGGGAGNLILSELQKGVKNITEPQAAAIEAYLNSMRFAVFEQNGKLDVLIATIQMQYGSGAENPVVSELKGIRGVLDNIYSTLRSVVKTNMGTTGIVIAR